MSINEQSVAIAANAATTLTEVIPSVGDTLGPWTVCEVGGGPESFWFYGGPEGVAYPDGTVVKMFNDENQKFKITGPKLLPVAVTE